MAEVVFLTAALTAPPLFSGHIKESPVVDANYTPGDEAARIFTKDDAFVLHELGRRWREYNNKKRAPVLFAYNYSDVTEYFRRWGVQAYSMTIAATMGHGKGHVRGMIEALPFQDKSLAVVAVMQRVDQFELFELCEAVAYRGYLLIDDKDLPQMAERVFHKLNFRKRLMSWHSMRLYYRVQPDPPLTRNGNKKNYNGLRLIKGAA